jgi:hypothetical protein
MTEAQDRALAEINNSWPVAKWWEKPDTNSIMVACDDGDLAYILEDGSWDWYQQGDNP